MQSLLIAYLHAMAKEASKVNSSQALIYRLIVEDLNKCPLRLVSATASISHVKLIFSW